MIGPDARDYTADVVKLLSDKNTDVRRKAADALGRIQPDSELAIPALIHAFGDENEDVRQAASTALGKLGPDAIPDLLKVVKAGPPGARQAAVAALGTVGGGDQRVITALTADLHGDGGTPTAEALAKQGRAAIAPLAEAMKSPKEGIRRAAIHGLKQIGVEAAPEIVDGLKSPHVDVRRASAQAFESLAIGDKLVVLSLVQALDDEDAQVRSSAGGALYTLGSNAKAAVPGLMKVVAKHSDAQVRMMAANILGNLGPAAKEALSTLRDVARDDKDPQVRARASWAAGNIQGP
jgi:HEAT repeat protein